MGDAQEVEGEADEQIRKAHEREGLSIRELARRFGVHRRDVRRALESAMPPERKVPVRPAPALDRWKPLIDGWLEADQRVPRKQRHTARRVWQRLVDEHDAEVGESTVRRYVAEVRRRMDVPLVEVMVPQHGMRPAEQILSLKAQEVNWTPWSAWTIPPGSGRHSAADAPASAPPQAEAP